MPNVLHYHLHENIAVITLDAPPVNGLGTELRAALQEAYQRALDDSQAEAIIITSANPVFCGGADIAEFKSGNFNQPPWLPDLLNQLEESPKLIVAAMNGLTLGGGLELALACDYRFAQPNIKLGLPEVTLGILPGAGGTQRLPRLAEAPLALDMITSGKPIDAAQAQQAGLVDQLHNGAGDFLTAALEYTKELLTVNAPLRNCANMCVDTSDLADNFISDFRASIAPKTRGYFAPERCIQAVEAACTLPFYQGLEREAALFQECVQSPQARALQHLFFAERDAVKVPGVEKDTPLRPINKVAVIGSGTMGGGIAMNFANAGIETIILDLNEKALQRGMTTIRQNYEISAKKGRIPAEQVEVLMERLTPATDYDAIGDVDLVIEAVFENMTVKQQVFQTLDKTCKAGAILATNTSTLDINEIAAVTRRPEDVIGLHFFSPANVMRLLEIVRADKTSPEVIASCLKMAKRIRKTPAVVGVCYGFVGNRMLEPYLREAQRLVLEGATPEQVDKVLTEFGLGMGVIAMTDLAGQDISFMIREARREQIAQDPSYQILSDRLYELGRYGQKTGRGFYRYQGRDRINDPDLIALAEQTAAELGIERRTISDDEIRERCVFMLINEGAQILDEGIAYRSSDCDLIWVNGYGFPAWRGGPLQYADEIGLDTVLSAINRYRDQLGGYGEMWFKPAPLLEKLVAEGKTFKDHKVQI